MAITGAWKARQVVPEEYAGALQWGSGVNPVHAVRSGPPGAQGRIISVAGMGAEPSPEEILGPTQWGYCAEDEQFYAGEDYRYLRDDHPNWGENGAGRPDRSGEIQEYGLAPQPEGWPSWGPHFDDNPVDGFPVGGPTGGGVLREYTDGLDIERRHAIAVPTGGVSGGWLNKQRGAQLEARTSDPAQYEVNTSMRQVHQSSENTRAVVRHTDETRTAIRARTAGMKTKTYGKSFEMGGGPGTPQMFPYQQDVLFRPFFYRSAGVPPMEQHTWNEMEGRTPIQRSVPDDPYMGEQAGGTQGGDFGYTSEDGGFF